MRLIQTSLLSGLSTFVKMLTGFVAMKFVAVHLGPSGIALCGQFATFINIIAVLAGGGITYGVIKYVAEYANSSIDLKSFLSSAVCYTIIFALPAMIMGMLLDKKLSLWILGSADYAFLFFWLSIAQFFIAIYLLINSILNGFKQILVMTKINIMGALIGLLVLYILVLHYQIKGALVALIITQLIPLFISIAFIYREKWVVFLTNFQLDIKKIIKLSHFSVMTIISVLTVPVAQIIVRNDLNTLFTWEGVGYWQAVIRVSDAYLLLATTALTAYYMPRLSELNDIKLIKHEIIQAYKIIAPCILLIVCVIYLLRDFIIYVLYSKEFAPARDLFLFQFLGDFFRIIGWFSTYLLLAKSWSKMFISTEIILSVLFVVISHFFVRWYGLVGVTYGFALVYFVYWLLMLSTTILYFFKSKKHA